MKIGKLDIGFWHKDGKILFTPLFEFLYPGNGTFCGCYMFTICGLCFAWLSDECYYAENQEDESE